MALYQASVQKKYIKSLDSDTLTEAYQTYSNYFLNPKTQATIKGMKEEEFQEGFLRELFVKVLGYKLKPTENYNLVTELKNPNDSKKADGGIIHNDKTKAVIELKSTKTIDFKKIEIQAFNYKNSHSGCTYVITSNFAKLRFYIDNKNDFEEFNLFELDEEAFKLMYLCISHECLTDDIPTKAKNDSVIEEEKITKKLYKDYSDFKRMLFDDIVKRNPTYDKLILFKKTQKLMDRLLFIFFAEDKGLLPPNSISRIIDRFKQLQELDSYKSLYAIFKQYFGYMNIGRKGKKPQDDIHAYNGGLFAPDDILDNIEVSDNFLESYSYALSSYDFDTEVDVNILGHIFEHSLNEIEEIQAQLEGRELEKNKTKRKKDGVFYTPRYITKYIVENTLGKLCDEKKHELKLDILEFSDNDKYYNPKTGKLLKDGKELLKKVETYRKYLLDLKIVDPACGSGAFLNQALDYLIEEHNYTNDIERVVKGGQIGFFDIEGHILENNIYGVDINEESVEIAKLSLWIRTAKPRRKLNNLSNNIKCGNSLIDDKEVAGNKAFSWEKEFPNVFSKGGFDVVIGNPPYVFARDKINQPEKDFYTASYVSAEYQINTYLLFMEKSIKIINNEGYYGLIVPNAWLMVYSATGLRKYILETSIVNEIVNLSGYSFEGVNVETIILNARKGQKNSNRISVHLSEATEFKLSHTRDQDDFKNNEGFEFQVFSDDINKKLSDKLKDNSTILDELALIKAGLKAYQTGKGKPKQTKEDVKNRPFDYDYKYDENTFSYLEGKNVGRYTINWTGLYLRYGKHLAEPRMFLGEKIIIREITGKYPNSIIATLTDKNYLFNLSNIAVLPKEGITLSMKYLLVVLNSKLLSYFFLKNTAKSVRKMFPKIILKDLRKFPIKEISKEQQKPFIVKADIILSLSNEKQKIVNNLIEYLKAKYDLSKTSRKLAQWYILDIKVFLAELKKAKIKLGMEEEMELLGLFKKKKIEALTLQVQINKADKKIDSMVYELYGLTAEEIQIIENSVK